jgi:DNA-binding NarL/FixJ family response regulator
LPITIDSAQDGMHAAKLVRASTYWALLTDRLIPPWPGLSNIPKLKRRFPHLQVVVFLQHDSSEAAPLLRIAGADVVIEPPLRRAALVAATRPGRDRS